MRYIKTFEFFSTETGQALDYEEGDIVICSDDKYNPTGKYFAIDKGDKYKVLKIYKLPEDKFLKKDYMRVDVVNLETNEITKGWESTRFKTTLEFDVDKYNL
jgi:hypothetical protein